MSAFLASSMAGAQFLSKLFSVPGFTLQYIIPDWMHTVCLGVLQYLMGNVMWELFVHIGGVWSNPAKACAALFNIMVLVAQDLGVERPFSSLVVTMIRPAQGKSGLGKRPRMRLKAAQGRNFLPILTIILQRFFPCAGGREELRLRCCQAMCRCYMELKRWTDESPRRLELAARQCLLLYVQLGDMEEEGSRMWHVYPKHHMFAHVANVEYNPALVWNYGDEDEIGRAVKQARRCNPKWLHQSVIERYRITGAP